MFLKPFILLLIFSILYNLTGTAQVYFFKKYDTSSGLIQNTVKTIEQDKSGRLWIGTAEGLSIYDGEEFVNYYHNDGLKSLVINCFYEINDSIMLVGSNGSGVYVFQKPEFGKDSLVKIFSGKKYLINNNVNKILKDWENNFWFCTDSGITKWSMTNISSGKMDVSHYGKKENFPGLLVQGTVDLKNKTIWFGTEKGLVKSDGKKFFRIKELNNKWIYSIVPDADSLIIGTSKEILIYKSGSVKNFNKYFGLKDLATGKILKDSKGAFWFATSKGLLRADGNRFNIIDKNYGLGDDFLFYVTDDIEGNIWVGSINGFYKYSDDSFNLLKGSRTLRRLRNLKFDKTGKLWIVTYDGFFHIEKEKLVPSEYNSLFTAPNNTSYTGDMILTDQEDVWISTLKGIFHISPGEKNKRGEIKKSVEKFGEKELAPEYSYKICLDKENNLWVQNNEGKIFIISSGKMKLLNEGNKFKEKNLPAGLNGFPNDLATCMYNDSKNNMWIGYFKWGLFRISGDSVKKFSTKDGLYDEAIRSVYEDSKGSIWIGTRYSGVYKYSDGKFTQYSTNNGLNSNWVRTIIEDKLGNMWFGTAKGVIRFNGSTWKVYDEAKGIEGGEILCSAMNKDGTVYFGAPDGIYYQQPSSPHSNILPEVFIKRFQFIDGKNAGNSKSDKFGNDILFNMKAEPDSFTKINISNFDYNQNSLVFEFTSTSLRDEEKTLYSYKLEGFDEKWSQLTSRNYVSYINLPAGDYKFRVKAKNSDGQWSENPAAVNFIITPPFWEEWWFRLLAFVFIVGSAAVVTTIINRYRMAHQLKVEKMRTKIATDLHDDIGTSLSSIAIFSQLAKRKIKGGMHQAEEYLEKIEETSRRLIDDMSDIVWSINPANDSLEDAVLKMENFAVKLFEAKGIEIHISVSKEINNINLAPDIRRNILLIFKEMITNVAKHSEAANANIKINLVKVDHHRKKLIMEVEDDGVGFDVNKVYSGNGLKNLKSRSDAINGNITITSNKKTGTSYLFQMQIKN